MTILTIDNPSTWPSAVTALLDGALDDLRRYEQERRRIDALCARDVRARMNPPENEFTHQHDDVLCAIREAVAHDRVQGWHCTRLTNEEVDNVMTRGLRPLSRSDLIQRIDARVRVKDIPANLRERLTVEHQADSGSRAGAIHFAFTRDELRDRGAVGRLLRSWGGEALYNSHEDDIVTGALLRRIGTPRIVEVRVPVHEVRTFQGIAESIYRYHMHLNGVRTANPYGCEGTLRRATEEDEVERVLSLGEEPFEALTGSQGWQPPLS